MVTVSNTNSNNFTINYLKRAKNSGVSNILSNDFMHIRCYVYIVNFIVMRILLDFLLLENLYLTQMLMLLIQWW
jgi:hypothetical protein